MNKRVLPAAALLLGSSLIAMGPASTALATTAPQCPDGATQAMFDYAFVDGSASVTVARPGCTPERVYHASSYTLDQSAENTSTSFGSNPYAFPQSLFDHGADILIPQGYAGPDMVWTSSVDVPLCGDYQIDLYNGPVLDTVDGNGHSGFKAGEIVLQDECEPTPTPTATSAPPVVTATPAPSVTTSPAVTVTTAPSTAPVTSTSPTTDASTSPATTTSSSSTGTSNPGPTSATATVATTATTTTTTTPAAAATTTPARAAGVNLAFTGASGTSSFVAVATGLLGLGVVAVLMTRRLRARGSHTSL